MLSTLNNAEVQYFHRINFTAALLTAKSVNFTYHKNSRYTVASCGFLFPYFGNSDQTLLLFELKYFVLNTSLFIFI